jgi:general secretion pathway protein I
MPVLTRERAWRGFTLLEVMIAIAILAISLTAVLRLQGMSAGMAGRVKFETVAPLLAQAKMSEAMSVKSEELASDQGDFGDDWPEFTWKLEVEPVAAPENLGETGERLRRLRLSVVFRDGVYSYELGACRLVDKK